MDLTSYGFFPHLCPEHTDGDPARVTAVHRERYALMTEQGPCFARLKSGVYHGETQEPFPTAGDFVLVRPVPGGDGQIVATLPRKSFFARRSPVPGRGEQAVAANFDYVFIVQSLDQNFNLNRLERYLALSWQSGAVPVVVLTKADLAPDWASHLRAAQKSAPGVGVFAISARTGLGLDALDDYLKPRKTIVLLGSSGVGKSSLVNALSGGEEMAVGEVRTTDGRGRHTTTHRQLLMLPCGAMVIDTPGMREMGLWDAATGLDETFGEVEQYLGTCKFSDCTHQNEPGCAIRSAIASGALSQARWERYVSLQTENRYSEDKEGYLKEKQQRFKQISQTVRQMQKLDYRHTPCPETFTCRVCGAPVAPEGAGSSHRNHCPSCLSSLHVDNEPGDRASLCKGVMEPIGVWVKKGGEWAIIHRCRDCGALHSNRVAADDNPALLLSIAAKPLAAPPFPLNQLRTLI